MTTASNIATGVQSATNSSFSSQLEACLTTNGFTGGEISSISSLYANILSAGDLAALEAIAQTGLDDLEAGLDALVASTEENKAIGNKNQSNSGTNDNYVVQDAKVGKVVPEKKAIISKLTSMPAFPSAGSGLSDEYPDTYGKMDDAKNWYKVNKTTKYTEFVHFSGSSLKIDKTGNVAIHITGNLKWIIDKDFLMNVMGNHDHAVVGSEQKTVLGNLTQLINGSFNIKAAILTKLMSGNVEIN